MGGPGGERVATGEHLVQDDTQSPEITARSCSITANLFRRHIRQGADHGSRFCEIDSDSGSSGDTEVEDLSDARFRQQYIGRFDVAVDYALAVGSVKPAGDLPRDIDRLAGGQRTTFESRPNRFALVVGHHDAQVTIGLLLERVHRGDIRVIERGSGAGLNQKPLVGTFGLRRPD